ncbi:unnamed protein product [Chrysoparadoxa australica]
MKSYLRPCLGMALALFPAVALRASTSLPRRLSHPSRASSQRLLTMWTGAGGKDAEQYVLRFDGGSRGNPGVSGAGAVIYRRKGDELTELWHGSIWMGDGHTCNEAEYTGVIKGMEGAKQLGIKDLHVEGDSQLIVRQLNGAYKVNSARLKPLFNRAKELKSSFSSIEIAHIYRADNTRADQLANAAMDSKCTKYWGEYKQLNANEFEEEDSAERGEYVLQFGGGSRGSLGESGAGAVIYQRTGNKLLELWHGSVWMGDGHTRNEAEYTGLIKGMEGARQLGIKDLHVEGDCQLIVDQLNGAKNVKSERLRPLFEQAAELKSAFSSIEVAHIVRADNHRADSLAHAAITDRAHTDRKCDESTAKKLRVS